MTFLNTAILGSCVAAVTMPLVIHLLNKQFPMLFEFSSITLLRETMAQRSRLYKWRHRILMAMRTLFLILLLLAFLKPVLPRFGGIASGAQGRMVIVVIDHSLSMEHTGGGQSARQRAITSADQILAGLSADDVSNVIIAGPTAGTCFFDWSHNHAQARSFVSELKPGTGGADFSLANATAARLFGKDPVNAEIYYLSDFQRKNWAGVDYTALPPSVRLFWNPASDGERANQAILGAAPQQGRILTGDTISIEVELGNYSPAPFQAPLRISIDGTSTFEREAFVGPWASAKVAVPIPAGAPGLHLCEISIPADDLPGDNKHHLVLEVGDKEGVLLVSDSAEPGNDAPHYLRTALNPFGGREGSLKPELISSAALSAAKLAGVKKVIIAKAGPLSERVAADLAAFVFNGGGVMWFLDGPGDVESNVILRKALGGPLPLNVGPPRIAKRAGADAQQIARGDFQSKFLRMFRGTRRQDLSLLEFYDIRDCSANGTGRVLLHFGDDTPAMAEFSHGLGTILMLNFSANELSSNLARQRAFPAWIHEMVKYLSPEETAQHSAIIGQTVTGEGWAADLKAAPLRAPDGTPAAIKSEALGERTGFSLVAELPGFYTHKTTQLTQAFAVNPPPEESDLRPLDATQLQKQTGASTGFVVSGRDDLDDLVRGRPLWQWFILAATAMLVMELVFQMWIRRVAQT